MARLARLGAVIFVSIAGVSTCSRESGTPSRTGGGAGSSATGGAMNGGSTSGGSGGTRVSGGASGEESRGGEGGMEGGRDGSGAGGTGTAGESGRGDGGTGGRGTSGEGGRGDPEGGMGGEAGSEKGGSSGAGGNAGASGSSGSGGMSGTGGNAGPSSGASGSGGAAAGMSGSAGSGPTGFSGPDPTLYYTFDARDVNGGVLADRAGSYDGTVGGSIVVDQDAPVGDAMVFPGGSTASSIVSPNVPLADRFTLSVWIKTSTFPTGEALRPLSLGAPRPTEPIGRGWALGIVNAELRFAVHATLSELVAFPIALDEWVHTVAVSDVPNRTIRIYRNGVFADEATTDDPSIIFATAGFVLGYQTTTNDRFFVGAMDELALFSGIVLTPAQISELYALGNAGTPIRI